MKNKYTATVYHDGKDNEVITGNTKRELLDKLENCFHNEFKFRSFEHADDKLNDYFGENMVYFHDYFGPHQS
jgi:hypothetical protein